MPIREPHKSVPARAIAVAFCACLSVSAFGQEADVAEVEKRKVEEPKAQQSPEWLKEHMAWMVEHSPLRASNEAYRSDQEPFEAYFTEWKYGPGSHSLIGRLYGVRDGCPSNDFWSFRLFWDPVNLRVHSDQLGLSGAYGVGTMSSGGKDRWVTEQTFSIADGPTWKDRHEISHRGDTQTTRSFKKTEGEWTPGRVYAWSGPAAQPVCHGESGGNGGSGN